MTSTSAFAGADIGNEQERLVWSVVLHEWNEEEENYKFFFGGCGITICYEINEHPLREWDLAVKNLRDYHERRKEELWLEFCEMGSEDENEDENAAWEEFLSHYHD